MPPTATTKRQNKYGRPEVLPLGYSIGELAASLWGGGGGGGGGWCWGGGGGGSWCWTGGGEAKNCLAETENLHRTQWQKTNIIVNKTGHLYYGLLGELGLV